MSVDAAVPGVSAPLSPARDAAHPVSGDAATLEVRTEPLGGTALARAALAGHVPPGWYPPAPRSADEWQLHADAVRRQFSAGAWLELLAPALDVRGPAADRIERSARGAGVVVTTGQQPGLFGGPLYTFSKALSALALADALERATGVPTAPVFWAATDDADFDEASRTIVPVDGGAVELRAERIAPDALPMSAVPLGDDVPRLLETLQRGAGSGTYVRALEIVRRAYRPGVTVGAAYVQLLRELLAPLGIAVLDASHAAVRHAGFQLLRRTLLASATVDEAVAARGAAIRAQGLEPQVEEVPGRSLVFRYDAVDRKARVPVSEARGLVPGVRPGELGPNVLLRPVVERHILPTVGYLAGPGEYAYFAQVSAVAAALSVPQPLALPRWSGTIVEPHVRRTLQRYGLDVDALADPHAAETRLARAALSADVVRALDALRASVLDGVSALRAADEEELVPAKALDGAEQALRHHLERVERRYLASVKRRDDDMRRSLATARGALYPMGVRQERAVNAMPLLARHGPALWDAMLVGARRHAAGLVDPTLEP